MPELPEVETMRRGILAAVGSRVVHVEKLKCTRQPIRIEPTVAALRNRIMGRRIAAVDRLGKRVVIRLDSDDRLVFEPRMTGLVLVADPPSQEHLRFRLDLAGGPLPSIWYWDRRGLGSVRLFSPERFERELAGGKLGPDALAVTAEELQAIFAASTRPIKVALLDQAKLAGVGNMYASEILHLAGISPEKPCHKLKADEWQRLHHFLREVLETAIRYEGSTLSDGTYRNALNQAGGYQNHHRVYDRAGQACGTCGVAVLRIVQAQRATFYCPGCQPSGRRKVGAKSRTARPGLTRAEIITLGVILLIAVALLLPWIANQRSQSRRNFCESRQANLARSILLVADTDRHFPGWRELQAIDADGERQATSWVFPLLPYLDRKYQKDELRGETKPNPETFGPHKALHDQHGPPGKQATRGKPLPTRITTLLCPADPRLGDPQSPTHALSYVVNAGLPDANSPALGLPPDWPANGVFLDRFWRSPTDEDGEPKPEPQDVTLNYIQDHDGTQYTLLMSENLDAGQWHEPTETTVAFVWVPGMSAGQPDPGDELLRINQERRRSDGSLRFARPSSLHQGGVITAFCDGSTRFLSDRTDYLVFAHMMTPDGAAVREAGSEKPIPPPYRAIIAETPEHESLPNVLPNLSSKTNNGVAPRQPNPDN